MIDNLTEAIAHYKERARTYIDTLKPFGNKPLLEATKRYIARQQEFARKYEQLAAWLEELAERREADKWNFIHTEADLPKESDWYFVTRIFNSRKYVATVFFNENTKRFYEDSCTPLNNIIAWKPLPEPYTESEDKQMDIDKQKIKWRHRPQVRESEVENE